MIVLEHDSYRRNNTCIKRSNEGRRMNEHLTDTTHLDSMFGSWHVPISPDVWVSQSFFRFPLLVLISLLLES